jgi:hypothetical protein
VTKSEAAAASDLKLVFDFELEFSILDTPLSREDDFRTELEDDAEAATLCPELRTNAVVFDDIDDDASEVASFEGPEATAVPSLDS